MITRILVAALLVVTISAAYVLARETVTVCPCGCGKGAAP